MHVSTTETVEAAVANGTASKLELGAAALGAARRRNKGGRKTWSKRRGKKGRRKEGREGGENERREERKKGMKEDIFRRWFLLTLFNLEEKHLLE